ncbi:MAG: hybrid sensor histidine kinase/response regulator [Deltaproteobacteria bacterium]|nr:hybrid sensor histidine kinase/response regulator [Deltaproteobacteria bacterium]
MALILIVERNKVTGDYVAATLEKAGHETLVTSVQTEALAMFQERRPDLVMINYFLTGGDGISLLEALLRLSPGAMVVMTTGLGNEALSRRAMTMGAFDYVVKGRTFFSDLPFLVDDLMSRFSARKAKEASEQLRTRLEAQAELAGWLDHNFKNILSAVAGSLGLIDFGNPGQSQEKRGEYLDDGLGSLAEAMRLLENLGRMTGGGSQEAEKSVLVSSVVDEAWQSVRDRLRNGPAGEFSVSPGILDGLSFINEARSLEPQKVVRQDLLSILEALLKNALEAVAQSPDPRIIVTAGRRGEYLDFSVRDNGRGMDERVRRHAFEPLFSTKGQVGVGLSLTTVMALVTRHLGQVDVVTGPGQGCQVKFTYKLAFH